MEYANLGRSGLKVSRISLGSWLTFGKSVEDDETRKCVYTAIENGINLIDTADIYNNGAAEVALSKVIKDFKRESLVIASKTFFPMNKDDKNNRGLSRKHIIESIEKTLTRLGIEYLDLYQCHRPDFLNKTPIEETVAAMSTLIEQGKILYWGVSCWTAAQITEAYYVSKIYGKHSLISNQPHYSMLYRKIEEETMPVSQKFGVSQIVWSPLEQGILTGKYNKEIPSNSRANNKDINIFMEKRLTEANLEKTRKLEKLALEIGLSTAQLALAWVLRREEVASAIVGVSNDRQLLDNIKAVDVKLSGDVLERIEDILQNSVDEISHGCE